MSYALYENAGLRFWTQNEIRLRNRIKETIVDTVEGSLLNLNQMWRLEEVDTPVLIPRSEFSSEYEDDGLFLLSKPIGDTQYALRGETTNGSYKIARQIMKSEAKFRPPMGIYTMGQSFRREESDGATAAKLRFYAFYQLEFQLIFSEDTKAPIAETLRSSLKDVVEKITGHETRIVESDRLPAYSEETIDIEVQLPTGEWKEVASTSIRNDFPQVDGQKRVKVFEIAFGMDRMVCITQGNL